MAGWINFILIVTASIITIIESGVIPEPATVIEPNNSPVIFLREKRTVLRPHPHKAMLFTGYYRPIRRTGNDGHATGLFAQGNAVSGQAFFGGMHATHLNHEPEPIEESEVSSAHAQAAPAPDEEYNQHHYHHQNEVHRHDEEQYHNHHHHEEEKHHHYHHQDSSTSHDHYEPEQIPPATEIAQPAEEPIAASTEVSVTRPNVHHKNPHKTPVTNDDDEDEDEEDEEDDDHSIVPFVPFKGNRRRQKFPHLNNFFPMIFSFPRLATRRGSSGSAPGTITAIANSYSTGKGGVASSVATAYGGSPIGKKRRPQPYEE